MTPRAFRRARLLLGVSQGAVGRAGGYRGNGQSFCSNYERGIRISAARRDQLRIGLLCLRAQALANARRPARRARWAAQWPVCSDTRTALVQAAGALDQLGDPGLADWLLAARPEHARAVATGVIVHALIRHASPDLALGAGPDYPPHPWDTLIEAGVADFERASAWFDDSTDAGEFVWEPESAWLFS